MIAGLNPAVSQGSLALSLQNQQTSDEPKSCPDPSLSGPTRSLYRRRVFQELFCTFYDQVLHGCHNSTCRTPTCAGYRRRKSKGPFRPFTTLSARALAAHLASEDHPSKKICPYIKAKRATVDDAEVRSIHTQIQETLRGSRSVPGEGTQEALHSLEIDANQDSTEPPPPEMKLSRSTSSKPGEDNETSLKQKLSPIKQIKLENTVHKGEGAPQDSRGEEPVSSEAEKKKEHASKGKDQKSLAQNLFDTASIAILQLARVPYMQAFSTTPTLASDNGIDCTKMTTKHASLDSIPSATIRVVRAKGLSRSLRSKDPKRNIERNVKVESNRKESLPKVIDAHHTQDDWEHANKESGEDFLLTRGDYKLLRSTCELCECKDFRNEPVIFCLPRRLIDKRCLPLKPDVTLRPTPQSGLAIFEPSGKASEKVILLAQKISHEDARRWKVGLLKILGRTDHPIPIYQCMKLHKDSPYITLTESARSLSDMMRSTDFLLKFLVNKSLHGEDEITVSSADFAKMVKRFSRLHQFDPHPRSIFSSLWQSAGFLYLAHPTQLSVSGALFPARRYFDQPVEPFSSGFLDTLNLSEAAHIVKIDLAALVGSIKASNRDAWLAVQKLRRYGHIMLPRPASKPPIPPSTVSDALAIIDALDDDMGRSLVKRLAATLACRRSSASFFLGSSNEDEKTSSNKGSDIINVIVRALVDSEVLTVVHSKAIAEPTLKSGNLLTHQKGHTPYTRNTTKELRTLQLEIAVEWLRGILLSEWDGNVEIPRCSAIAGALGFLSTLYIHYGERFISPEVFETPFVAERLDVLNTPLAWMNSEEDNSKLHLLEYPFLFPRSSLVSYFRAINHAMMSKAFQDALSNSRLASRLTFRQSETGDRGRLRLEDRLSKLTNSYLVLEIRRHDALTDALNQLWRRQKRELIRPLKVRLGEDEGEEGVDHGGVQQEFFRLAIAEALEPKYGAFTTDPVTHMSWFQPGSLEPLYKFELLGILTSLAIYNGLTLPFTFPIALYMKLLNHQPDHLEDIVDGWPELSKGLRTLGEWADGDVEDIFCRSYVFSMDVFGTTKNVDMLQRATYKNDSQSPEPSMVTNANREQYIKDYIRHLTHSSIEPQYEAFAKGFKTVVDPRSLSLFTPNALQALVQGIPAINTRDLESVTRYEGGYSRQHRVIRDFWSIVHSWSSLRSKSDEGDQLRVRQLLEFVTASDRLPVGGESRVVFVVQKNGVGDERLPTSLTCFGRLLLPEFSSPQVMEKMLVKAIENSKGFGQP